jgi:hypothetical protein
VIARKPFLTLIAAVILIVAGAAPDVQAGGSVFLTGTWTGKITCKGFFDGAKESFPLFPTITISQSGLDIAMRLSYSDGPPEDYSGRLNPDPKKPLQKAEFAVVACGTNDQVGDATNQKFDEVGRMATSVKGFPEIKGTFKGLSIFSDYGTPAAADTCKWSFKRTATTDPNLPFFCDHTPIVTLPPSSN